MASSTNPLAGQQQTQEPDVAKLIKDAVSEYMKEQAGGLDPATLAQQQQSQGGSQGSTQPLRVNVDGQDMTFPDASAMSNYFLQERQKLQQAVQAVQQQTQSAPQPRAQYTDGTDAPKPLDIKVFADKLVTDPVDAMNLAYETKYGIKDPIGILKLVAGKVVELEQQVASEQFKNAHPEYEPTQDNAAVMQKILQAYQLPFNSQGLELAYARGVQAGLIKPVEHQDTNLAGQTQQGQGQQPLQGQLLDGTLQQQNFVAPPNPGRSGVGTTGGLDENLLSSLDKLPKDKLQAIINQMGFSL